MLVGCCLKIAGIFFLPEGIRQMHKHSSALHYAVMLKCAVPRKKPAVRPLAAAVAQAVLQFSDRDVLYKI